MGSWSDRVLAILPAEVTAVYLAVRSIVSLLAENKESIYTYIPYVLFICILILTVAAPFFAQIVRGLKIRYDGIIIAVSFLIWALNIDYQRMVTLATNVYDLATHAQTASDNAIPILVVRFGLPIILIMWAGLVIPIVSAISAKDAAHETH
jgi:hypothetical protein